MFLLQASFLILFGNIAEGALKCKATNGMDCVFPFKRPGSMNYTECAPSERSDRHWCATSVKADQSYDTWSFCRKDDCDVDSVGELDEMMGPWESCFSCLKSDKALVCARPCVLNPNKLWCYNCLVENDARNCSGPCLGPPNERIDNEMSGTAFCQGIMRVDTVGQSKPTFPFTDRSFANKGNITQILLHTGVTLDQFEIKYGTDRAIKHGGAGGGILHPDVNPLDTSDIKICKVEGNTGDFHDFSKTFPNVIRSLQFTDTSNGVFPATGEFYGVDSGDMFTKNRCPIAGFTGCFLRYISGGTTGDNVNAPQGNYVSQLSFHWCCDK